MRQYTFDEFRLESLQCHQVAEPKPGPGQVCIAPRALSLNFRDVMLVQGTYNPRLPLPAVPISDAAGVVEAVGQGVEGVSVGDRVVTHFVADWRDGRFREEYLRTTLGTPGPGLAADRAVVPAHAVLPMPARLDFAQAATLPIAALTAWSALVTEGEVAAGQTVLTLGTGGVSIFALQIAKALGVRVAVTSSSDEKLARARALGADHCVNYRNDPKWEKSVLAWSEGGVDLVIENGGVRTLSQSLRAVRAGGRIAMLGALTGLMGEVDIAPVLMKRVRIAGILVDSRAHFEAMLTFFDEHEIAPVIESRFGFDDLRGAYEHMQSGAHFGKIVVEL